MPVTITLPCAAAYVAIVRPVVRMLFSAGGRDRDAELVVTELLTNSVRHSRSRYGGRITVVIDVGEHSGRIEVIDAGPDAAPSPPTVPGELREGGRGLADIVETYADKWGHDVVDNDRHRYWAELSWS